MQTLEEDHVWGWQVWEIKVKTTEHTYSTLCSLQKQERFFFLFEKTLNLFVYDVLNQGWAII